MQVGAYPGGAHQFGFHDAGELVEDGAVIHHAAGSDLE
jgi:hypothetical protein